MGAGYSEIVAHGGDGVYTELCEFCFDIPEVCMEAVNGDSCFLRKDSDLLLDVFSGAPEIVTIEVEPDEYVSLVQFLDNPHRMTSESEGAVNHDIPLCIA